METNRSLKLKTFPRLTRPAFQRLLTHFGKLEYLYAGIALTFGIIFIFVIPPGWSPDEPQHYWRVQQIVHGGILPAQLPGSAGVTYTGGTIPANDATFILSYKGYTALDDRALRIEFPMWNNNGAYRGVPDGGAPTSLVFAGSARYSPIVYLPQLIGIGIANILHAPLLVGFFLAKVFGLIVQIVSFVLAIRLIPRGKWILFVIGLLPSTVVQSVAIGGDITTTSACILLISYTLYLAYGAPSINKPRVVVLLLLTALVGLVKPAYLPLAAIALLIPIARREYRTKKFLIPVALLMVVAALPGIWWLKLTASIQEHFGNGVDVAAQSSYVLHHPLAFASAFARTYLTDDQPVGTFKMLFGNFVWGTAPLPLSIMLIGVVVLVISWFLSSKRESLAVQFSRPIKILFIGIFFALIALISYSLYTYFTPLHATSILGVQGRYFIPFLPLLLLAFHTPLPYDRQLKFKLLTIFMLVSMQISALIVLVHRIYI